MMKALLLFVVCCLVSTVLEAQTVHELEGVEVLSDIGKFKRDSAMMDSIYRKRFGDAQQKMELSLSNGLVLHGLFSNLATAISGKKKRDKRFMNEYQRLQREKLITIRYNPANVSAITKLQGDSLGMFMNAYPMEEAFARTASELELKMWIRNNYKLWCDRQKNISPSPD